jgi:hypothetical protein
MKVISVHNLSEKFEECDITTVTQNFYVKAGDSWLLIHNSPALVAGWRDGKFMLTDKAGFSAKSYDGLTTNAQDLETMILNRKIKLDTPEAQAARQSYAHKIASLYPLLKQVIPSNLKGYVQGDLLWTETPPIQQGAYVFQPNKIRYSVPVMSDLGAQIGTSKAGIVFHSMLSSPQDESPDALRDPADLGITSTPDVVVVPHEMQSDAPFQLNPKLKQRIQQVIRSHQSAMDHFLNPSNLGELGIKSLPHVMKSFLAHKAGAGEQDMSHAAEEFLTYVISPHSKVSVKAAQNMIMWIKHNVKAYNATWQLVQMLQDLKLNLKAQMDNRVGNQVKADLKNVPGHEGFVSVTPAGIIKLVNRAQFMKKDAPLTEAVETTSDHSPRRVVFTYGRLNPPTSAHRMLVDKVAQVAGNDDYWVFLSHSQDAKKNPLTWTQKVSFVKQIMRPHAAHVITDTTIKTPLQALNWLYDQHYRDITLIVGSDRVSAMTDLLNGWNSDEIRAKDHRDAVKITVVSAGERDPDAEGMSGISGTRAREAVKQNDLAAFQVATGVKGDLVNKLFDAVKQGMQTVKVKPNMIKENAGSGHIVMLNLSDVSSHRLADWCRKHHISTFDPDHMHMTVICTEQDAPHVMDLDNVRTQIHAHPVRWEVLGSSLALVCACADATRLHDKLRATGCDHKWPHLLPHVSVNYGWDAKQGVPDQVPQFDLMFDSITAEPSDPNFAQKVMRA